MRVLQGGKSHREGAAMARQTVGASSRRSTKNPDGATRREFLKGATSVAAGLLVAPSGEAASSNLLPEVPLGSHRVTRLMTGANPMYGYSHFNEQYSRDMLEWFTDERVVEYLLKCEKAGINTWQSNYHQRLPRQFPKIRAAGCKIQWICLAAPWDVAQAPKWTPEAIRDGMLKCAETVAKFKPVGIAHHGWATDMLYRAGKLDLIRPFINKVHDLGFAAGVSTHNPVILDALEAKGWPNEFYMAAFYYVSRSPQELEKQIGVLPVGETYLSSDPPRMCEAVRRASKPCLVYKLLAAGRQCGSPQQVRQAFEFAFKNIKPTDAAIVGMYPRYSDQISENTRLVREILG
jgi:hypothetical protein